MNIYHLYRLDGIDYEEYEGKIIVAKNEAQARLIANRKIGMEGPIWNDPALVKCEIVSTKTEGLVLAAFNGG